LFLSGENPFDGRHCSKWDEIQDMADIGGGGRGYWSSVGENCLMVDIVSKWEEIQDMADIILSHGLCLVGEGERKGSLFLSGENL